MAEATLVDGTEVYTEGELEPGAILFVRAGEGADEDPFAPEGIHETTDGLLITVGASGEITNVEEKGGGEETPAEAQESFEEEEEVIEEKKEFDMDGMLEGIADLGSRMGLVQDQQLLNEAFNVQLKESLSGLEDIDYAKAISDMNLQMVALQAAQQTYAQTRDLNLFSYL